MRVRERDRITPWQTVPWGQRCDAPPLGITDTSVLLLDDEVKHARGKFPGNRHLLAALTEEVGELAKAMLQRKSRDEIVREAIQVACVAIRIVEEGDASFVDVTDAEAKP